MMDWATATVRLPRWVVWAALLTSPAVWSRRFTEMVRRRLRAGSGGSAAE